MRSTTLKIFAAAVLLSTVAAVAGAADGDATLKEISSYRQWARLTPEPFRIEYDGPLS
ncbi:MAG TPA: hypothetical protein VF297_22250 [Pyrinomonadaceae bacterium]